MIAVDLEILSFDPGGTELFHWDVLPLATGAEHIKEPVEQLAAHLRLHKDGQWLLRDQGI